MARDYITPATNFNDGDAFHRPQDSKYYPHFKDAIGAIDGTHIKCRVAESERTVYFGRKGYATQNILAVCDFNMCFTFAWAGWEGGAHDSRILNEARLKPELNFPHPTENKYYLVDAGYAHKKGYMAPYKGSGIRYHIQDFRRANGTARLPRNTKERFNHLHSSCRMVIERTFGVWKARFCILANMPMYKINTQTDIVLATMMIHNYIRKSRITDNAFETAEQENYIPENATSTPNPSQGASGREGNQDRAWSAKRDEIAANIP
nr:PREDICTED: putative nuclease HARBI1 [Daucus carota subsp. sativus]